MSDVLRILRSKLGEVELLEESMRLNREELHAIDTQLKAIVGRMDLQRQLIHARSIELQDLLNLLESFVECRPPVH